MITAYSNIQLYVVMVGKQACKHLITYRNKPVGDQFSRKIVIVG